MKTYTIVPVPCVTWVGMGSTYVGVFGVLWLFVEPLGAFGLIPPLGKLSGFYLYSLLLAVPAFVLLAFVRWYRWYKTHDLPFVMLSIRSAADGVTYSIRAAENMQVNELLRQYTEILKAGPAAKAVEATLFRYFPVLQVKRNEKFIDIQGASTLYAAGIKDGEECQVRAQEFEHMNDVMFYRVRDDA